MNTPRIAALLSLPFAMILAVSAAAQGPGSGGGAKGDYSSKDSAPGGAGEAAGEGEAGGAKELIFPFKEAGESGEIKSELKCMGGKPGPDDSVSYDKCGHRSTDGFDEVAVKIKMLSKNKLRSMDKKKLRRAKELAALKAAKKHLKKELGGLKKKKDASKKQLLGKLEGAARKVDSDLSRAVSRCKEKDASDMDCDADFPPEEE